MILPSNDVTMIDHKWYRKWFRSKRSWSISLNIFEPRPRLCSWLCLATAGVWHNDKCKIKKKYIYIYIYIWIVL